MSEKSRTEMILREIKKAGRPLTRAEIVEATGFKVNIVRTTLYYMLDKGMLINVCEKPQIPRYSIPAKSRLPDLFRVMLRTRTWEPGMLEVLRDET